MAERVTTCGECGGMNGYHVYRYEYGTREAPRLRWAFCSRGDIPSPPVEERCECGHVEASHGIGHGAMCVECANAPVNEVARHPYRPPPHLGEQITRLVEEGRATYVPKDDPGGPLPTISPPAQVVQGEVMTCPVCNAPLQALPDGPTTTVFEHIYQEHRPLADFLNVAMRDVSLMWWRVGLHTPRETPTAGWVTT